MMAKQHRGSKPRPVIGTHHGLMHGSQSHQQLFYRSARLGSNSSTNTSPKGSARSSFSKYTANRNSFNLANVSLNSPKTSTSSNSSSLMDRGTYKVQYFNIKLYLNALIWIKFFWSIIIYMTFQFSFAAQFAFSPHVISIFIIWSNHNHSKIQSKSSQKTLLFFTLNNIQWK